MGADYRGERTASLRDICRLLRRTATPAERKLWDIVRDRRLGGLKFRRQHQFGPFILDFFCAACSLAVEVDGAQHSTRAGRAADVDRDAFLENRGVRVLRFANDDVLKTPRAVSKRILEAASDWQEGSPGQRAPRTIIFDPDFIAPSPFAAGFGW